MGMYGKLGEKVWSYVKPILIFVFVVITVGFAMYGSWHMLLVIIEAIVRTIKNA